MTKTVTALCEQNIVYIETDSGCEKLMTSVKEK